MECGGGGLKVKGCKKRGGGSVVGRGRDEYKGKN